MKKVLFVTSRLIYPVNDGRKVVLYNYCKGLSEKYNCKVRLFYLIDNDEEFLEQPKFIDYIYYANTPNKLEKIKNLIIKSLILKKWPFQVSLYYSKKSKDKLEKVISEYKPDIVIADMARTAEYLKTLDSSKYNKILDMDDILSKRYERQLQNGRLGINSIGAYAKKLPSFLRRFLKSEKIMKVILCNEVNLLKKYERYIHNYFKSIIFVSPIEAEEFNKIIKENKSIDITIGVDYEYFSESVIKNKRDNLIVFLGNMFVAHNKDAIMFFIESIFPRVLKELPDSRLRIVGKCPEELKNSLSKNNNIEVTGEVEDIRYQIQEATIAVAPLTYGSGIKTKVLETMAMGVPTITNDIGIEGIDINDYLREKIIKNNSDELSSTIISLLNNKSFRNDIIEAQSKYIYENHQWDNILKNFEAII